MKYTVRVFHGQGYGFRYEHVIDVVVSDFRVTFIDSKGKAVQIMGLGVIVEEE